MIRKATIWDAVAIVNMWGAMIDEIKIPNRKGNKNERTKYLTVVNHLLGNAKGIFLIEKDKGFISGRMAPIELGVDGIIGYIDYLYVKPEYRNSKVGHELGRTMEAMLMNNGASEINIVTAYDSQLIKRYTKDGYQIANITFRKVI